MEDQDKFKGLAGWLVLVGLGVVISPIRLLISYVPIYLPIFRDGTWEILTTVGSEAYHPLWGPLIIGEVIYNLSIVAFSFYLIYLFFSKHYLFPKFYIGIVVVSLIVIPLDAWFLSFVLPNKPVFDPDTILEFSKVLVVALVWVPYMLISKRVKATFVEKTSSEQIQPTAETRGAIGR